MESSKEKDTFLSRRIILEHYETPIHKIDENNLEEMVNYKVHNHKSSSCIDNITVYLKIENSKIVDAKFSGIGCAISSASTDILCDLIINKEISEVKIILNNYFKMINLEKYDENVIGNLYVFENVGNQMNRIKCALVGINAINNILEEE